MLYILYVIEFFFSNFLYVVYVDICKYIKEWYVFVFFEFFVVFFIFLNVFGICVLLNKLKFLE